MKLLEKMLLPLLGILLLSVIAKGQCDSTSITKSDQGRIIAEPCYQSIMTQYNALQDYKTSSDSTIASMKRELDGRTRIGIALSVLESNCYQLATDLSTSNQKLSDLALQNNTEMQQCSLSLQNQKRISSRNLYLGGGIVLGLEVVGMVGYFFFR